MDRVASRRRQRLLERRRMLLGLSKQVEPQGPQPDPLDRAADLEAIDRQERLNQEERRELEEIEAALARMAVGTYGRCQVCLGAIGQQRLHAIPEARTCISCAKQAA